MEKDIRDTIIHQLGQQIGNQAVQIANLQAIISDLQKEKEELAHGETADRSTTSEE